METKNIKYLPDGYVQIDEVIKDLHNLIYQRSSDIWLVRYLNQLISKMNVTKEIISYNPRLPLQQIEQKIIEMCKGASYHGVNISISFITKYPERDLSNFCFLSLSI
ncbi:hypothetical protein ACNR9Q_10260 [Maribacter sp. X9]|uniref:hypothetical protein n=1 Tax=Maribacter sp. X9 TaxID=3402159 RepID=UPI003AF4077E